MKQRYHVEGMVADSRVDKWVWAYSENQAIKIVALNLAKQYPALRIFIEDARATPS